MGNTSPVISAIAAALLSAGGARANVDGGESRAPDVVSTTPVRVSLEAKEVIENELRRINFNGSVRTAQATSPYSRYQRYRNPGGPRADDKTPFEKGPTGFDKAPGAFSNFSMPDPRVQDRVINPGLQQQQQRLRNMQQNRLKIQPGDVQAAFDLFKES
jgi:hypothetical protein